MYIDADIEQRMECVPMTLFIYLFIYLRIYFPICWEGVAFDFSDAIT